MIALQAGGPSVVAVGGGHGLARTLGAARRFAGSLAAVVSVADNGGSSGRLREALAIPAPGDLRRAIGAMLACPDRLQGLLEHRFGSGELAGHAFGNLLIAACADYQADFVEGVAQACRLLGTLGPVYPATIEPVVLRGEHPRGSVRGQVEVMATAGLTKVGVEPEDARTPPEALEAVREADLVVLGPGSLFTSVLAALAAPELAGAIGETRGLVVYVCNLREQQPETAGFDVAAHLSALLAHGIRPGVVVADLGAIAPGRLPSDIPLVAASLTRARQGLVHDEARLGEVLAALHSGARGPRTSFLPPRRLGSPEPGSLASSGMGALDTGTTLDTAAPTPAGELGGDGELPGAS